MNSKQYSDKINALRARLRAWLLTMDSQFDESVAEDNQENRAIERGLSLVDVMQLMQLRKGIIGFIKEREIEEAITDELLGKSMPFTAWGIMQYEK